MSAPVQAAHQERAIWWAALACFVLAAFTGAFMRFGMIGGFPWGLEFGDVRHAHSHLMFFSWVTPLLIAFAATLDRPQRYRRSGYVLAWLALWTGLLTYVPFLLSGYGRLELFGRDLPVSMMAAGPAGLAWYGFVVYQFLSARGIKRTVPLRALDGAALNLLLASIAVTAVPIVMFAGLGVQWRDGLIDVFLEAFGEGWFALALLGLAHAQLSPPEGSDAGIAASNRRQHIGIVLLTTGLIVGSLARLTVTLGGSWAEVPALLAATTASSGLVLLVAPLILRVLESTEGRRRLLWLLPLLFMLVKALADPLLSLPALAGWMAGGMRILFLHAFLLGAVSLGLVALTGARLGREVTGAASFGLAVLLMLAGLIPLTPLWPGAWSGAWILHAAAWTSLGPPSVALIMLGARAVANVGPGRESPLQQNAGSGTRPGGTGPSLRP